MMAKFNSHLRKKHNNSSNVECGTKAKHETKWAAQRQIDQSGRKGISAYRCSHCGYFHIGHRPGLLTDAIAKKEIGRIRRKLQLREYRENLEDVY